MVPEQGTNKLDKIINLAQMSLDERISFEEIVGLVNHKQEDAKIENVVIEALPSRDSFKEIEKKINNVDLDQSNNESLSIGALVAGCFAILIFLIGSIVAVVGVRKLKQKVHAWIGLNKEANKNEDPSD